MLCLDRCPAPDPAAGVHHGVSRIREMGAALSFSLSADLGRCTLLRVRSPKGVATHPRQGHSPTKAALGTSPTSPSWCLLCLKRIYDERKLLAGKWKLLLGNN